MRRRTSDERGDLSRRPVRVTLPDVRRVPIRFLVVSDETEPCPYIPGQRMRLPLRMPTSRPRPEDLDLLLADGDRRSGPLLYRPSCDGCSACEALRVPVARFKPSRSQRRVWRRNEGEVRVERHRPAVSSEHLRLYNSHSRGRGLSLRAEPSSESDYRFFLVDTCVETWEMRYFVGDVMVAVSVIDLGHDSVSSVYHYFDPEHAWRSLGVYSILKEIEMCAAEGREWYYLGLYVASCDHLNYKADYYPHQRRINGQWVEFTASLSPRG